MTEKKRSYDKYRNEDRHHSKNWTGILFILLGVFLLLQTTDLIEEIDNWWAFFILVPGIATYITALQQYRSNHSMTIRLIDRITSGTITTFVGCVFLFEWHWGRIWPVFLIVIGLEYVLKDYIRNGRYK